MGVGAMPMPSSVATNGKGGALSDGLSYSTSQKAEKQGKNPPVGYERPSIKLL